MSAVDASGIDVAALIEDVRALVAVPTSGGGETTAAEMLAARVQPLGVDAVVQEVLPGRSNLLLRWSAAAPGPTMLLNGHLDMLAPPAEATNPYTLRVQGDAVVGAGLNNMKGAVGAMIAALRAVVADPPSRGSLVVSAVAAECDTLGLGTVHALEQGLQADACLNGEPTGLDLLTEHAGVTQLRVVVRGLARHVSERPPGINANVGLARVVVGLDGLSFGGIAAADAEAGLPTVTVGVVRGGSMPSCTAGEAEAVIDVRSAFGMTPESIRDDVAAHLESIDLGGATAEVLLAERPAFVQQRPFCIPIDHRLVEVTKRVVADVFGGFPAVGALHPHRLYGSDASHLSAAGIPTVICGPGSADAMSDAEERLPLDEVVAAARIYAKVSTMIMEGALHA